MSSPNPNLEVEFNKLNLNETLKDTSVNTVSSVDNKMGIGSKSETAESSSNDKVKDQELENFAKKLDIKPFSKNIDEIKKFYKFAGPNFIWPSTMNVYARREVFDFIILPDWEDRGEELAKNTIAYRELLDTNAFDSSKGSHVLIINGKLIKYGDNMLSYDEYDELQKEHPGSFYVPIIERTIILRKFSAIDDVNRKEWQDNVFDQLRQIYESE